MRGMDQFSVCWHIGSGQILWAMTELIKLVCVYWETGSSLLSACPHLLSVVCGFVDLSLQVTCGCVHTSRPAGWLSDELSRLKSSPLNTLLLTFPSLVFPWCYVTCTFQLTSSTRAGSANSDIDVTLRHFIWTKQVKISHKIARVWHMNMHSSWTEVPESK